MKITCDNCSAKYSISDEKVRGKVFKIRCKKCSQIIVVRGASEDDYQESSPAASQQDAYAGQAQDPAPSGGGDSAIWHVALVDGSQVGPVTAAEVRGRFSAQEINGDSYIWCENFSDWAKLSSINEFADLFIGGAAAAPASAEPASTNDAWGQQAQQAAATHEPAPAEDTQQADSASLFGNMGAAQPSAGQDLFASDPQQAAPAATSQPSVGDGLFGASAASSGGGDLFPDDNPIPSDPAVAVSPQMTGQRGENSVLFSLANLQSLAMGENSSSPSPAASAAPSPSLGGASGGGSGLIDIRAMSMSTLSSSPAESEGVSDMPSFAAPIAAAPVLMPTSSSDRPAWLLPTIIGGAVVLVGLLATVIILLATGGGKEPTGTLAQNSAALGNQKAEPAGGHAGESSASGKATEAKSDDTKKVGSEDKTTKNSADKADSDSSPKKVAKVTKRSKSSGRTSRKSSRRTKTSSAKKPAKKAVVARRSSPAPRKKGGRDDLDDLLDGAMKSPKRKAAAKPKAAAPAPNSNLPKKLGKGQIVAGMRGITGRVKNCFDRFRVPGLAMVKISISPAGRVTKSRVQGIFAGTPTGSCIQKAVRGARFAKTQEGYPSLMYPFNLR